MVEKVDERVEGQKGMEGGKDGMMWRRSNETKGKRGEKEEGAGV